MEESRTFDEERELRLWCRTHPDKQADLYCQVCTEPICYTCSATRHRDRDGHDCQDVRDVATACRQALTGQARTLDRLTDVCRDRIAQFDAAKQLCRDRCGAVQTEIIRRSEAIRKQLEDDLRRLLAETEEGRDAMTKQLECARQEHEALLLKLNECRLRLKQLAESGSDAEVILARVAHGNGTALVSACAALPVVNIAELDFSEGQPTHRGNVIGNLTTKNQTVVPRSTTDQGTEMTSPAPPPAAAGHHPITAAAAAVNAIDQRPPPYSPAATAQPRATAPPRPPQPWACSKCTFINRLSDVACEVCLEKRAGNQQQQRSANLYPAHLVINYVPPPTLHPVLPSGSGQFQAAASRSVVGTVVPREPPEQPNAVAKLPGLLLQKVRDLRTSRQKPKYADTLDAEWTEVDCAGITWRCSLCTYENHMRTRTCEGCGFAEDIY